MKLWVTMDKETLGSRHCVLWDAEPQEGMNGVWVAGTSARGAIEIWHAEDGIAGTLREMAAGIQPGEKWAFEVRRIDE